MHIDQAVTLEKWQKKLEKRVKHTKKPTDKVSLATKNWWRKFWQRNHIFIGQTEKDTASAMWQMDRNYQLFRYMLGCNASGGIPHKIKRRPFYLRSGICRCGLSIFTRFPPLGRRHFTSQNQRLVYWPMLKSGDFDMMLPQFEFYRNILANAKKKTRFYWNVEGANFTEQIENYGLPQPFEYNANIYIFIKNG